MIVGKNHLFRFLGDRAFSHSSGLICSGLGEAELQDILLEDRASSQYNILVAGWS